MIQPLAIEDKNFEAMRMGINAALVDILTRMVKQELTEGEINLKISVELIHIDDILDPDAKNPIISYKISTVTKQQQQSQGMVLAGDNVLVRTEEDLFGVRKAADDQLGFDFEGGNIQC